MKSNFDDVAVTGEWFTMSVSMKRGDENFKTFKTAFLFLKADDEQIFYELLNQGFQDFQAGILAFPGFPGFARWCDPSCITANCETDLVNENLLML